jgi:hypothetical protein
MKQLQLFCSMLALAAILCSCASTGGGQQTTISTPRENVQPVHAAGGVLGVVSGIFNVITGGPMGIIGGVSNLTSSAVAFDNAANKKVVVPAAKPQADSTEAAAQGETPKALESVAESPAVTKAPVALPEASGQ